MYTLAEAAIEEAGFEPMETYIWRRHNTSAQYIATRTILDLCKAAERKREDRVGKRWWEQVIIDLSGARDTAEEAAEDGDGLEE